MRLKKQNCFYRVATGQLPRLVRSLAQWLLIAIVVVRYPSYFNDLSEYFKRKLIITNLILNSRLFNGIIAALILISVAGFSLETIPTLSDEFTQMLWYLEVFIVIIFTLEYLFRIAVAEKKLKFVFSVYGMIDLLAILPFYLAFAIDLRALRLLRLFRLARLLKLVRYTQALNRFIAAFHDAKEELVITVCASAVLIFLAAVGIYHFENPAQPEVFKSIFDCLWWAVATSTTVGYGEVYPITVGGKIFTTVFLFFSIGLVAIPTGIFSSSLLALKKKDK